METSILWKGEYYQSLEKCTVISTDTFHEIRSIIVGFHDGHIYQVDYHIQTDVHWQAMFVRISANIDGKILITILENKNGRWHLDSRPTTKFENATFVDISLSPFTNTLPISGLQWTKAPQTIDVIYFDVLAGEVSLARQVYKPAGAGKYNFATADGSFQATLTVDLDGFVTHYPSLFKMIAKQNFANT